MAGEKITGSEYLSDEHVVPGDHISDDDRTQNAPTLDRHLPLGRESVIVRRVDLKTSIGNGVHETEDNAWPGGSKPFFDRDRSGSILSR